MCKVFSSSYLYTIYSTKKCILCHHSRCQSGKNVGKVVECLLYMGTHDVNGNIDYPIACCISLYQHNFSVNSTYDTSTNASTLIRVRIAYTSITDSDNMSNDKNAIGQ